MPPMVAGLSQHRRELRYAVDAVLQRDDTRPFADQCARLPRCRFGVPELDGEQHKIDRPDGIGVVCDIHVPQMQVAERALDAQAVAADRVAMRAARDEDHLVSGLREAGAEIAADSTRRHDRHPHVYSIWFCLDNLSMAGLPCCAAAATRGAGVGRRLRHNGGQLAMAG
jgi:hypothetical protein